MPGICLDFDGVLYSYKSGFVGLDNLPDLPVDGAQEFCRELIRRKFDLFVHSTRFSDVQQHNFERNVEKGKSAVRQWLYEHDFPVYKMALVSTKPAAMLYLDDRGFRFEGSFTPVLAFIDYDPKLKSWVNK